MDSMGELEPAAFSHRINDGGQELAAISLSPFVRHNAALKVENTL
jgi:hypothetical protein